MLLWPGGCSAADGDIYNFKDNFLGPLGNQQVLLSFPPAPAFSPSARAGDAQARAPSVWPERPRPCGAANQQQQPVRGEWLGVLGVPDRCPALQWRGAGRGRRRGRLGWELRTGDAETCEWELLARRLGANREARGTPVARRGGDSCGGCGGWRLSGLRDAKPQHPAISRPGPLVPTPGLWANFALCCGGRDDGRARWRRCARGEPSLYRHSRLAFSISSVLRLTAPQAEATAPQRAVKVCCAAPNRADRWGALELVVDGGGSKF